MLPAFQELVLQVRGCASNRFGGETGRPSVTVVNSLYDMNFVLHHFSRYDS